MSAENHLPELHSGLLRGLLERKSAANVHEQNLKELLGGGDLSSLPAHGAMLSGVLVQSGWHQVADDFPLVFDKRVGCHGPKIP